MADATDRPRGAAEAPTGTANAAETQVAASPNAAPEEGLGTRAPAASETYRPLSLLALAGFGVAVLYALVVGVGGAIALFNRAPLLMPTWTFVIPVAALIVCGLARARIRASEETLSGLAFTTWGIRLVVVAGLLYTAYYTFTFFALRLQAIDCADQFFTQLQEGRPERAFLLAMGEPVKDMADSEARNEVEARFNKPMSQSGGGVYDQFRRSAFVRAILMMDRQASITPRGVTEWGYQDGGYRAVLKYHVATSLVEFDMNVTTFGPDSPPGESRGRQWHVMLSRGETNLIPATMKVSSGGEDYHNKGRTAWSFASAWQERVNRLAWEDAYLDTLDPSQRERLLEGRRSARLRTTAPLAGPAALGLYNDAGRDFLAARNKLADCKLFHIDDKRFWVNKQQRAAIVECIEKTFQLGSAGAPTFSLRLQDAELPMLREVDGRLIARFDAHLTYVDPNTMRPSYIVDGQLVVSAPAAEAGNSPAAWRVDAIEPESGRTSPMIERARQMGGGPGMGGPPGGPPGGP